MGRVKKQADAFIEEAELLMGLPRLRDSVDKDDLPIPFILKRGRERADAKAAKKPTPAKKVKRRV